MAECVNEEKENHNRYFLRFVRTFSFKKARLKLVLKFNFRINKVILFVEQE